MTWWVTLFWFTVMVVIALSVLLPTNTLTLPFNSNEVWNVIKKEILAQIFSSEFYEISRNTFFNKTPLGDCFCYDKRIPFVQM